MSDVFTKAKRSEVMSRIRSRGNKETELEFVKLLRSHKITGWKRHAAVPGKPDFVFPKDRVAVFVDGCFWHGCRWHCRMPSTNRSYWKTKIARNIERDRRTDRLLRKSGWKVLRVWRHSLRSPDTVARRIISELKAV